MHNNKKLNICRICGLEHLDLPWGDDNNTPSFIYANAAELNLDMRMAVWFQFKNTASTGLKMARIGLIKKENLLTGLWKTN